MKQILQSLRNGQTDLIDVPAIFSNQKNLLIHTQRTLISAGTERMLAEFGKGNLIAKAHSQPDKVRQVLDKVSTDGVIPTAKAVFNKLDQPLPLGYCNSGVIQAVGAEIEGFRIGDRVVSNGPHAEVVNVPQNLCAKIPDPVQDEDAAFTVLGAVALQGIRLLKPTLGEQVVVSGLGLVGLMAVQMLIANGCQVLGLDFNPQRLALAQQFGADVVDLAAGQEPVAAALKFSGGRGVDGVLIAASTKSNDPVQQAAQMCRQRGRIVLVGVTGLTLNRADFYEKELSFQVSCSYGPGRYDPNYEERGQDYPLGFVRWTAQRNFETVLQLMADGKLDVQPLISHRVPFDEAPRAYELLVEDPNALGIVLTYSGQPNLSRTVQLQPLRQTQAEHQAVVGLIGAGNFAQTTLLPVLKKVAVDLQTIASAGGASAAIAGRKYGFTQATSDYQTILDNPVINTVFITTRHNSHARLVVEALAAGKHVFVEKPLALNREDLAQIEKAIEAAPDQQLLVGFNRRFAPLAVQMKQLVQPYSEPLSMVYTVNAGAIPADHWVHDAQVGGGRIIGEGCHFIDFLAFLADSSIVGVTARMMGHSAGLTVREDKMTILLDFANGSTGVIHYLANGSKRFPKERVEVFCQAQTLVLDNFRKLVGYGWSGFKQRRLMRQDKGHRAEMAAFVQRIEVGGEWLIPWATLKEVTLATFAAVERAKEPPLDLVANCH